MTRNLYSTPDAIKYPKHQTPEALAFQGVVAALDLWPAEVPFTDLDAHIVTGCTGDVALSIYLQMLANF